MKLNPVASMRDSHGSHANVIMRRILDRIGGSEILRTQVVPAGTNLFLQWGFKRTNALDSAIKAKIPFIICDLGYFDEDRLERFSISLNGFNGLSQPVTGFENAPDRPHPPVKPWNDEGNQIVVVGQMPGDAALRGQDIEAWMHRIATQAAEAFDWPVKKRPHPKMLNPWEPKDPPFVDTLDSTFLTITWTSNCAVMSCLNGTPAVAMHPASMAWPVAAHRLSRQIFPGRHQWVHDLAWRQYKLYDDADCDLACEYILRAFEQGLGPAAMGRVDTEGMIRVHS